MNRKEIFLSFVEGARLHKRKDNPYNKKEQEDRYFAWDNGMLWRYAFAQETDADGLDLLNARYAAAAKYIEELLKLMEQSKTP